MLLTAALNLNLLYNSLLTVLAWADVDFPPRFVARLVTDVTSLTDEELAAFTSQCRFLIDNPVADLALYSIHDLVLLLPFQ